MNILRFLKSTKGAIKPLNALLISGAAGVGFFFVANTAANKQIQAERQVRTLSSMQQGAAQEGMRRQGGMLTSINVRDGLNQLATEEERAAKQGNTALDRYNANQKALGKMEATLGGMDFGPAAQTSDSDDGLGTGNRQVIEEQARYSVGNPRAGVDAYQQYKGTAEGASATGGQGGFTKASMAHASGNSFAGTSGPISSSASGGIVGANAGKEGPRRLSGAMPGGSNIVSQMGLEGALAQGNNTANFDRTKNTRGMGGRRTGEGNGELNDILKKSAAAAANANASANEGGRAFLANARSSGGVTVDGGTNAGSATSSDLSAPTAKKLKAIGNRLKKEETKQEERLRDQNHLKHWFWSVLAASAVAIVGISLLHKWDNPWSIALRWILVAGVAAINIALFVKAAKFYNKWAAYGGTALVNLAKVMAPVLTAAAVYSAIKGDAWSKIWNIMKTKFKEMFGLAGITATAMGAVGNAAKSAVGEAIDSSNKKS